MNYKYPKIIDKKLLCPSSNGYILTWDKKSSIDCNIEWENLIGCNKIFGGIGKNSYSIFPGPRINGQCTNKFIINDKTNTYVSISKDIKVICGVGIHLD